MLDERPSAPAAVSVLSGDRLDAARTHVELRHVVAAVAIDSHQPEFHVIDVVQRQVPVAGDPVVASDRQAEGLGDFPDIDAQGRGPLAIDIDQQFGLVQPQGDVGIHDSRNCLGLLAQLFGEGGQLAKIGARDGEIDVDGSPLPERRLIADADAEVLVLGEPLANLLHLLPLGKVADEGAPEVAGPGRAPHPSQRKNSLVHVDQPDVDVCRIDPRCAAGTDRGKDLRNPFHLFQLSFDGLQRGVHRTDGHSLGCRDADFKLPFVHVGGNVVLADPLVERNIGSNHAEGHGQHDPAVTHRDAQAGVIAPLDPAIEAATRGRHAAGRAHGLEQARTHHGRQGKADDHRDQNGDRGGQAELEQHASRDARQKRYRQENDHQAQGDRQDREADFTSADNRRLHAAAHRALRSSDRRSPTRRWHHRSPHPPSALTPAS